MVSRPFWLARSCKIPCKSEFHCSLAQEVCFPFPRMQGHASLGAVCDLLHIKQIFYLTESNSVRNSCFVEAVLSFGMPGNEAFWEEVSKLPKLPISHSWRKEWLCQGANSHRGKSFLERKWECQHFILTELGSRLGLGQGLTAPRTGFWDKCPLLIQAIPGNSQNPRLV